MRVLITGHKGFVGSAFFRHFWDLGNAASGIDSIDGHDAVDFFRRDGRCYDLVIHCAAIVGGRAMIDGQPLRLAAADLALDAALFDWALRTKPGRIVYFSSSAAYPVQLQDRCGHRLSERDIRRDGRLIHPIDPLPDGTYGMVKKVGERLAAEANAIGIPVHVFRPFSGYGEHQDRAYPFPAFVQRAAKREQPFDVWGRGDSARDWVHIDDVVGAVMAAIDADARGPVNICTGRATTFDELAEMVMRRAGYTAPIRHVDDAPQGVHWRVGDPTLLYEFYWPRISLEEGIARALVVAA